MPHYAVRITHSYEVATPIVHLWAMKCEKILAYEHIGSRTGKIHIHLLLVNTSVDKKQLRNIAATTKIAVSGNEWMSFKAADLDTTYITYMSKGEISPSYNKGYTDEELLLYKSKWVPPQEKERQLDANDKVLMLWNDHYPDLQEERPDEFPKDGPPNFFALRREVKIHVWHFHHKGVYPKLSRHEKTIYRMLMDTIIFKNNIKIPDAREPQYDMWKW